MSVSASLCLFACLFVCVFGLCSYLSVSHRCGLCGCLRLALAVIQGADPASLCTGNTFYGCFRTSGAGGNILNPIQSVRIRTAETFSFQYGRVEASIKLPLVSRASSASRSIVVCRALLATTTITTTTHPHLLLPRAPSVSAHGSVVVQWWCVVLLLFGCCGVAGRLDLAGEFPRTSRDALSSSVGRDVDSLCVARCRHSGCCRRTLRTACGLRAERSVRRRVSVATSVCVCVSVCLCVCVFATLACRSPLM